MTSAYYTLRSPHDRLYCGWYLVSPTFFGDTRSLYSHASITSVFHSAFPRFFDLLSVWFPFCFIITCFFSFNGTSSCVTILRSLNTFFISLLCLKLHISSSLIHSKIFHRILYLKIKASSPQPWSTAQRRTCLITVLFIYPKLCLAKHYLWCTSFCVAELIPFCTWNNLLFPL